MNQKCLFFIAFSFTIASHMLYSNAFHPRARKCSRRVKVSLVRSPHCDVQVLHGQQRLVRFYTGQGKQHIEFLVDSNGQIKGSLRTYDNFGESIHNKPLSDALFRRFQRWQRIGRCSFVEPGIQT